MRQSGRLLQRGWLWPVLYCALYAVEAEWGTEASTVAADPAVWMGASVLWVVVSRRAKRVMDQRVWLVFALGLLVAEVAWIAASSSDAADRTQSASLGIPYDPWPDRAMWLGAGMVVLAVIVSWVGELGRWPKSRDERADHTYAKAAPLDWGAIILLPIGFLWPLAMLVIWTSWAWTYREKLLATLILPGGPWLTLLTIDATAGSILDGVPVAVGIVAVVITETGTAIFLARRLWRRTRAPSSIRVEGTSPRR